jgi:hypothetical protein
VGLHVPEPFEQSSRHIRERLAPIAQRVVARHRDTPLVLREPSAPMGVWFTLSDLAGAPLLLVSAHASAVNFLLGQRGFLLVRHTASAPHEALATWFEEILDAALSGGLHVDGDRATLTTRSGTLVLAG